MTADPRAELRAAAEKATGGVWKVWGMSVLADQDGSSNVESAVPVANTQYRDEQGSPRTFDADYIISAQPSVVLALLDDLAVRTGQLQAARRRAEAAEAEVAGLRADLEVARDEIASRLGDCIGCNYTDGPDEFCPRHGRSYNEMVEVSQRVIAEARAERDEARRTLDELVRVAQIEHRGEWHSNAWHLRQGASRLDRGYAVGGGNHTRATARILRRVADLCEAAGSSPDTENSGERCGHYRHEQWSSAAHPENKTRYGIARGGDWEPCVDVSEGSGEVRS